MPRAKLTAQFVESIKAPQSGQIEYWDERTPGLGMRISQGGRRTWTLLYRIKGRMRRLTLGPYPIISLADSRRLAASALREVHHGNDPATAKQDARGADSFHELTTLYIERHAKPTKRTWERDAWLINRELLPSWRNRKAAEIGRKDVIALLDCIVERGTPVLANRVKALISKVFNFAIKRGIVETNPAYGIGSPGGKEQARDRVLTEDEIRRVWKALDSEPEHIRAIFQLFLLTAQRRGEVTAMRWEEVDLDTRWWTIPAHRAKNGLAHRVPLSVQALDILRQRRSNSGDEQLIFRGGHVGQPIANLQKPMRRLKVESGVDFRIHDLRRTTASHMTGIGIPRLIVGKVLNHAEHGITAVYDRHGYDNEKRTALVRWAQRLREILEGKQSNDCRGRFRAVGRTVEMRPRRLQSDHLSPRLVHG